ncbi:MAG: ribosomal L7Ae/L30e/S12e/Gadd45 family protein [Oscillospiraceae bacterium]
MINKILQDVSLCKRAGKLVLGFDVVKTALQKEEVFLLIMANDLSEKSKKEVMFLSNKYQQEVVIAPATLDEMWYLIGKRVGIIGVNDKGLSEKIMIDYKKETSTNLITNEEEI